MRYAPGSPARAATTVVAASLSALACSMVGTPEGTSRPAPPQRPGVTPPVVESDLPGRQRPAPPRERMPEGRPPVFTPVRTYGEVRGLWVVRFTMTTEESVRAMVWRADAAGFNTLILQVRGRGDAYYTSRWEPRAEGVVGPPGFDPLALAIEEAHARGIAVHAWVNTHLVGDPRALHPSPDHIVHRHPDWLAVPAELGRTLHGLDPREPRYLDALVTHAAANSATVEGLYTSPSHPAVRERVYSVWMDLVERYDLDGIHFDYVRYPSADYDYSAGALERFRAWVAPRLSPARYAELGAAARSDPYAFADALPGPWSEFRRTHVDELVERIYHGVKARRPQVVVSAAVVPDPDEAARERFQDWARWLRAGVLDVAVPMAYTADDATFEEQIVAARDVAGERERVWAGVGVYRNTFDGTLDKIELARRRGAGGVVLFSYDWAVTEGPTEAGVPLLERVGRAAFER